MLCFSKTETVPLSSLHLCIFLACRYQSTSMSSHTIWSFIHTPTHRHAHGDTPTRARARAWAPPSPQRQSSATQVSIMSWHRVPIHHSFPLALSLNIFSQFLSPQWSLDSVVTRLGEVELSLERFEVVCVACSDQVHPIHKRECSPQIIPDVHCLRVEIQPSEVVLTGIVVVALVHE